MSRFKYSDEEKNFNKILKMNQDVSYALLNDKERFEVRNKADENIESSLNLLKSLGKDVSKVHSEVKNAVAAAKSNYKPELMDWNDLVDEADRKYPSEIMLEDIMSQEEIAKAFLECKEITDKFSQRTSIFNKTDLAFLAVATGLQVAKSLLFPYVAKKFDYGNSFNKEDRLDHNDSSIKQAQREATDNYRDEKLQNHETGRWINILYQTPAYDVTRGSKDLGINMGGAFHRLYTLGHDPILGWLFGTMNILTDTVTLNTFQTFRVTRNPMRITDETLTIGSLFSESCEQVKMDWLNLPAAVFVQAQHFTSDRFTKLGLPVPVLSVINEDFASKLYKENYDSLCFSRDLKIVGSLFLVSKLIDMLISLTHRLFCGPGEDKELFEVRTRKILLISNIMASSSSIVYAVFTSNPKNLDIGSLFNTITRLFTDIRFILRIKREFIENEISARLQKEIDEIDALYLNMSR